MKLKNNVVSKMNLWGTGGVRLNRARANVFSQYQKSMDIILGYHFFLSFCSRIWHIFYIIPGWVSPISICYLLYRRLFVLKRFFFSIRVIRIFSLHYDELLQRIVVGIIYYVHAFVCMYTSNL